MNESWKLVQGYEECYSISSNGQVMSLNRGKCLTPSKNSDGYLIVCLYKNKAGKMHRVHRLVANAFIPNPANSLEVNHIDGDKTNNFVKNLQWCTRQENIDHSIVTGLCKNLGETHPNAKLSNELVKVAKQKHATGMSITEIGKMLNVSRSTISHIINNRRWNKTPVK